MVRSSLPSHPSSAGLASTACPCGRLAGAGLKRKALTYSECCGRWHQHGPDHLGSPDVESLMRSRYCAYVLHLSEYLLATWHPESRPAHIEPDEPGMQWLGLEIRRCQTIDECHGIVEFVARYKIAGKVHRLHEISQFERDDQGHWLYVDGEHDH